MAENILQGIGVQIHQVGPTMPRGVEPDIDLSRVTLPTSWSVRRSSNSSFAFSRLKPLPTTSSWERSTATADVFQSCLRESENARTSRTRTRAEGNLLGIPPVLGLVLLNGDGVRQRPVEPDAVWIVPERRQGRPDGLPGAQSLAACRAMVVGWSSHGALS